MIRYSRAEAAAMIVDVLNKHPCPAPDNYGGWSAIMGDFGCLDPATIRTMVWKARKKMTLTPNDSDPIGEIGDLHR